MPRKIKPGAVHVMDVETETFFDNDLNELLSQHKNWSSTEGRGTSLLWSMLGQVYELAAKTDQNTLARQSLIGAVLRLPDVAASNRWKAENKSSRELLMTLLLGLRPETKSTKSQWLGALRAAEKAEIPTEKDECSAWIKAVGGVLAARKTLSSKSQPVDLKSLIAKLGSADPEQTPFKIAESHDTDGLPHGLALIIVEPTGQGSEVMPIATLGGEKILIKAIQAYFAAEQRSLRQQKSGVRRQLAEKRAEAMKLWKLSGKASGHYETFEQYLEDGAPEL